MYESYPASQEQAANTYMKDNIYYSITERVEERRLFKKEYFVNDWFHTKRKYMFKLRCIQNNLFPSTYEVLHFDFCPSHQFVGSGWLPKLNGSSREVHYHTAVVPHYIR